MVGPGNSCASVVNTEYYHVCTIQQRLDCFLVRRFIKSERFLNVNDGEEAEIVGRGTIDFYRKFRFLV